MGRRDRSRMPQIHGKVRVSQKGLIRHVRQRRRPHALRASSSAERIEAEFESCDGKRSRHRSFAKVFTEGSIPRGPAALWVPSVDAKFIHATPFSDEINATKAKHEASRKSAASSA
jgi:hypothetical protein